MNRKSAVMLSKQADNCSLIALYYISQKSEVEILNTALKFGYKPNGGISIEGLEKTLKALDINFTEVFDTDFTDFKKLGKVRREYPEGTYLIIVKNHVLAIIDGVIIDPNEVNYGLKRSVYTIYKIETNTVTDKKLKYGDSIKFWVKNPEKCFHAFSKNWMTVIEMEHKIRKGNSRVFEFIDDGTTSMKFLQHLFNRGIIVRGS